MTTHLRGRFQNRTCEALSIQLQANLNPEHELFVSNRRGLVLRMEKLRSVAEGADDGKYTLRHRRSLGDTAAEFRPMLR